MRRGVKEMKRGAIAMKRIGSRTMMGMMMCAVMCVAMCMCLWGCAERGRERETGGAGAKFTEELTQKSLVNPEQVTEEKAEDKKAADREDTETKGDEEMEERFTHYLMAYFTGGNEEIYLAASKNGYSWEKVNHGKPVLVSNVGTTGARDPFIIRKEDGSGFVILATDLCINKSGDWGKAQTEGSRSIIVWESADLKKWSEPKLFEVGAGNAGCVWAPEATYLPEYGQYAVYWASRTANDGYGKQRIWYAFTEDFCSFSEPQIWIDYPFDVIDTTVIREGDTYYRFTKYEGKSRVILESSKEFFGEWKAVASASLEAQEGVEGPSCFKLLAKDRTETANYGLLLDAFAGAGGYYLLDCLDLGKAEFTKKIGYSLPKPSPRHGSVVWITEEEYNNLFK